MRDLKISKKLIKNVLEKETENLPDDFTFNIMNNSILFADEKGYLFKVNIYEFAFKCREWAFAKNKIYLMSTKQDAIIKACEQILS